VATNRVFQMGISPRPGGRAPNLPCAPEFDVVEKMRDAQISREICQRERARSGRQHQKHELPDLEGSCVLHSISRPRDL